MIVMRYILGFLFLGGCWHAGAVALGPDLLPDPVATIRLFAESLGTPEFWGHILVSLWRLTLGLVAGQHGAHLPVQRRADAAQPHGNVLVHGGLAAPERSRRCPHRGVVGGNVLAQLHGALFRIGFHIPPPCVPALQWYNIRAAGAEYVCGLDILSPGAYTVGGHKNRGAVRLRSA